MYTSLTNLLKSSATTSLFWGLPSGIGWLLLLVRVPFLGVETPFLFHLLVQTNFLSFILGVWDSLWLLFTVPEAGSLDLWFYALALLVHFYAILVPDLTVSIFLSVLYRFLTCQAGHLPFSACLVVGSAQKASGMGWLSLL